MALYIDGKVFDANPIISKRKSKNKDIVEISFYGDEHNKISIKLPENRYERINNSSTFFRILTPLSSYRNSKTCPVTFREQHSDQERTLYMLFVADNSRAFIPESMKENIQLIRKAEKSSHVIYLIKVSIPNNVFFPIYFMTDNFEYQDRHLLVSRLGYGYRMQEFTSFEEYPSFKKQDFDFL